MRHALKSRSNKNTAPLFHHSLVLHSRGLSRRGKNYLSDMGLSLSAQTFSHLLRSHVALYQAALFSLLLSLPHAWWIDNYNKGFQRSLANLRDGTYFCLDCTTFVLVLLRWDNTGEDNSAGSQLSLPTSFGLELELFISSFDNYQQSNTLLTSLACALQVKNNPMHPKDAVTPRSHTAYCLPRT